MFCPRCGQERFSQDTSFCSRCGFLLTAAADVFNPDVVQRRRFTKSKRKQERDESIRADEALLADTGIRVLRERPVFTTPNVYPPKGFEPEDCESEARETIVLALRPTGHNGDVLTFHIAQLAQSLPESFEHALHSWVRRRGVTQYSHYLRSGPRRLPPRGSRGRSSSA